MHALALHCLCLPLQVFVLYRLGTMQRRRSQTATGIQKELHCDFSKYSPE